MKKYLVILFATLVYNSCFATTMEVKCPSFKHIENCGDKCSYKDKAGLNWNIGSIPENENNPNANSNAPFYQFNIFYRDSLSNIEGLSCIYWKIDKVFTANLDFEFKDIKFKSIAFGDKSWNFNNETSNETVCPIQHGLSCRGDLKMGDKGACAIKLEKVD